MLLTSTYYSHMPNQHYATHTPIRSSPLRERSVNAGPGVFDFSMSSPPSGKQQLQPQRAYKPNPALQTRDAATKRRRDMFFKRVQNSREDKKWESRGDQVCQAVHRHSSTCMLTFYSYSNWTSSRNASAGRTGRRGKHPQKSAKSTKSCSVTRHYHNLQTAHRDLSPR